MSDPLTLQAGNLAFSALQEGDPNDPLVVCLHGFPDSPATFKSQLEPLAAAGYRVVVPTLRGYEPTSQPGDGDYSLIALADDVIAWLDDLGVDRAHLVGHDWGAAIVYAAASRHGDRVLTATSIAIPPLARIPVAVRRVPKQLVLSWYMTFFQLRGLAERAVRAKDWWLLRRLWQAWSPAYELAEAEWAALQRQFEQPGVLTAALGYYRANATPPVLLGLTTTPAMQLTEVGAPTLIINGIEDGCMDRRLFGAAIKDSDFPAGVRHEPVEGAGHFVHLEQPDVVNKLLLSHLGAARH